MIILLCVIYNCIKFFYYKGGIHWKDSRNSTRHKRAGISKRQRGTFHLLIPCLETRVQSQVSGGGDGDLPAEGEDGDHEPDAGRDAGEALRVRTEQEEQPHLPRHSAGPSRDNRGVGNVLKLNT